MREPAKTFDHGTEPLIKENAAGPYFVEDIAGVRGRA
jgi:hypothetical protein